MTNTEQTGKHLEKLKGSDFEIADGEPDIRGWDVKDRDGKKVGKVDELIFDVQARKVRYMVVDTHNNDYDIDRKHILVPIGLAELHTSDDDVYLNGVSAEQVKGYPEYDNDEITPEHETLVRNLFPVNDPGSIGEAGLALNQTGTDAGYYDDGLFNESNLFKNRRASVLDDETMNTNVDEDIEDEDLLEDDNVSEDDDVLEDEDLEDDDSVEDDDEDLDEDDLVEDNDVIEDDDEDIEDDDVIEKGYIRSKRTKDTNTSTGDFTGGEL